MKCKIFAPKLKFSPKDLADNLENKINEGLSKTPNINLKYVKYTTNNFCFIFYD